MGLFSRPKCPVHRIEYSIGTNGLEDYYYCKSCQTKLRNDRIYKESLEKRISDLEKQKSHERKI